MWMMRRTETCRQAKAATETRAEVNTGLMFQSVFQERAPSVFRCPW